MMKWLVIVGLVAGLTPMKAVAVEWEPVTQNAIGDRFLVDTSSIQRKGDMIFFWEYREFPQPNNVFLEEKVEQPVHGVVLNWSANCTNNTQRLRQVTAYDKSRKLIKRFTYGETGTLMQPKAGSSASTVLTYVCDRK